MMGHDHDHGSGHSHDHLHGHVTTTNRTRLVLSLALIAGFMVVEVVAGVLAGSVALVADAGHMLVDAVAIGLSLVALQLAARPAKGAMTFGLKRVEILSAQINGVTLLVLAAFIVYESVHRLIDPSEVLGGWVLVTAAIGAVVNVVVLLVLSGADRRSLNIEGSYQHVLMDLLGSVAAVAAGAVILITGYTRADAIAALLVVILMVRSAWGILSQSTRVLLEAAPLGIDPDVVGEAIVRHPGVVGVHDLHVWEVTSGFGALSAHLTVARDVDCHTVRREVEAVLQERFALSHTTLQVDHEPVRHHTVGGGR